MKPPVILYKILPDELLARLEQHFTVTQFNRLTTENRPAFLQELEHAEGLIGSGGQIDKTILNQAPKLRAVSTISVGYDNFDVNAMTERGIIMMHTPTVLTETVADTVMALILSTARRVVEVANWAKSGQWAGSVGSDLFGLDVHHKTIGILGMGRIGLALAQRANLGFNMSVLYNDRQPNPTVESRFKARFCDLDTLLSQSDFVCISLPLTAQTHHLIGKNQLERMKPNAILINTGRGPVVDESALIEALKDGKIHGAGLDVYEKEPLAADSELFRLPNVVALPHIGSATHETRYNMSACAVDNLIAALTGKVEVNCVNPQVLVK